MSAKTGSTILGAVSKIGAPVGGEGPAHEVVGPTEPRLARPLAPVGIGGDEWRDPALAEAIDVVV